MGATLEGVCRQMVAAGLPDISPHELKLDTGRWVRYGPGKKAFYKLASYTTRTNDLLVSYGTFGIGSITLKVDPEQDLGSRLSSDELADMHRKREARQREEAEKAAKAAHLAANRAKDQWQKAREAGQSAYLDRKMVARPEGVRFIDSGDFLGWIILLLWHYGRGEIVGSQKIAPEKPAGEEEGDKRFNKGMAMEGAALLLGEPPLDGCLILIGEGYATVASARQALDYQLPVYMACNAGNLVHVARIVRGLYPASPLLFLADDDYLAKKDGTPNHTGWLKANEAAKLVGNSRVVLPRFTVPRRTGRDDVTHPQLTDFNDLHVAEGIEAVRVQLREAIDGTASPLPVGHGEPVGETTIPGPLHAAEGTSAISVPGGVGAAGTTPPRSPSTVPRPARASSKPKANTEAVPPPSPSEEMAEGVGAQEGAGGNIESIWAQRLLKHYAVIVGKNKFWDSLTKVEMGKAALVTLVGERKVVEAWLAREDKRTITAGDVATQKGEKDQKAKDGNPVFSESLARYVYLDGSDSIWDGKLRKTISNSALKLALGDEYKWWLNDPRRRVLPLENLVFDPTQRVKGETHINLFRGLPLKPVFPAGLKRYDDAWKALPHFRQCEGILDLLMWLCNHRRDVMDWLLCWLAYPLQHVGAKMDTAILMHGDIHGSGKSLFFECVIKPLYGEYAVTLSQHQLESQYTSWRSQRLFCLFEEVLSSNQKYSHTGTLKQMVTGKTHMIEKKFVDAWEEANHMNSVFLSNAVQPFHVEQGDRRFLVIWPGQKATEDLEAKVQHDLANGGLQAFYAFLLAHPLVVDKVDQEGNPVMDPATGRAVRVPFTPHTKPMMTPEKLRVINYGLSGWELFLREWQAGMVGGLRLDDRIPYSSCLSSELYKVYKRWCSGAGEKDMSRNRFSNLVSAKVPKSVRYYVLPGSTDRLQHHIFKVGERPAGDTEEVWLGRDIANFRVRAGAWGVRFDEDD